MNISSLLLDVVFRFQIKMTTLQVKGIHFSFHGHDEIFLSSFVQQQQIMNNKYFFLFLFSVTCCQIDSPKGRR